MKKTTFTPLILAITIILHGPAMAMEDNCFSGSRELKAWMTQLMDIRKTPSTPSTPSAAMPANKISPVARFYQQVGYRPVWISPDGLLENGKILFQTISSDCENDINTTDIFPASPNKPFVTVTHGADASVSEAIAPYIRQDVMLTEKVLSYASHIYTGAINPEKIYPLWKGKKREASRDLPNELAQSIKNGWLASFIESLHPRSRGYRKLRNVLQRYETVKNRGGWFPIEKGPTLQQGDRGPRVAKLKYRLKVMGDGLAEGPIENDIFDESVVAAVKHFQHRHGLVEDGLVGGKTLSELNVPVEKRIEQLQLNMERWRWFPDSFGDRYLLVNIPAFELTVVKSGDRIDKMRVIVGKKSRQTPVISDQMTYIEINPYWNVPYRIAAREILPKIKKDPAYLIENDMRVLEGWGNNARQLDPIGIDWNSMTRYTFPYRLRQEPSNKNSLGQIKFIFPNKYNVYIHDTPGKSLFDRRTRAYSHGCVRLENPMNLAYTLLSDQGWNHEKIASATKSDVPVPVSLEAPIPVHLVYFTAWVDEDQTVNFRKDIYGRDARLLQAFHDQTPAQCL